MTRPSLSQAQGWRPDALCDAANTWDEAAGLMHAEADRLARLDHSVWSGQSAEQAWADLTESAGAAKHFARALTAAAVAARDGAAQIASARTAVIDMVTDVRADGYTVADDGTVSPPSTGSPEMAARAIELTTGLGIALNRLGEADSDAGSDLIEAFAMAEPAPVITQPAGAWPVDSGTIVAGWSAMSQDRISDQVAAMSPEQRRHLIDTAPLQVGNTDGVPWELRTQANRINIADAILDQRRILGRAGDDKIREALTRGFGQTFNLANPERFALLVHADPMMRAAAIAFHDDLPKRRIAFYQGLLSEVRDPTGRSQRPVDRQILAFDPARSSLVELNGDLKTATSVGVLVPGLNTTVVDSANNTDTVRRFVTAERGKVAMITYLGGPFPTGSLVSGVVDAANKRYATDMAPRLVAFSEDVNRTVDATGRKIPVTYIGHSYGGSILGTAERLGLTADRALYLEAAGAGVGVDDPGDWHNRNPGVLRFSMTAPLDPIAEVQGSPLSPHGADPDEMPGVKRLPTGWRLNGTPMFGLPAHSDVMNEPSDAWHNILAVITGKGTPQR